MVILLVESRVIENLNSTGSAHSIIALFKRIQATDRDIRNQENYVLKLEVLFHDPHHNVTSLNERNRILLQTAKAAFGTAASQSQSHRQCLLLFHLKIICATQIFDYVYRFQRNRGNGGWGSRSV